MQIPATVPASDRTVDRVAELIRIAVKSISEKSRARVSLNSPAA
jgi:hypothetical protein